jgi:integrase
VAKVSKRTWKTAAGETRAAWRVDFVDQTGKRHRKQLATKRAADAYRVEIEGQVRVGSYRADAERVTISELCEDYLEHCRGRMERGERMTRHNFLTYEGRLRNHVLNLEHGISAVKLTQLTPRVVGDLRDRLRNAGMSVSLARKVLSTFHAALEYAIGRDFIAVNPARGVKVIGRRDESATKVVPPSKETLRTLIATADSDFRVQIITAAATGLRAGELHALRWRHLDLEVAELSVETRVDAYGEEEVPKTAAGVRSMPLSESLIRELRAWRLRSKFSKGEDLVFPNRRGGFASHSNMVVRKFKPLFGKEGGDPFTWHSLRHFAVSCWIEAGLSPKTIQTFAGHSSLQVTMDRYGHLFPSEDHRVAMNEIANRVFDFS